MDITKLRLAWQDFHRRVEIFELEKEQQLRVQHPFLSNAELCKRVQRMVDRHFKQESQLLLMTHVRLTQPPKLLEK